MHFWSSEIHRELSVFPDTDSRNGIPTYNSWNLPGNDFHPIEWEERNRLMQTNVGPEENDLIPTKPIDIGKNCFIGCNTIILKGTVLGDGCVVGAGAVVSGKFPPNSVIAGNPARIIRILSSSEDLSNG